MTRNLAVGGEIISSSAAMKLVDLLYKHAYELAGKFYEQNRSPKFRLNWPKAEEYAEVNKRAFIEQARADFTSQLGNPRLGDAEKKRIYLALLLERSFASGLEQMGREANTELQIKTDSQQFVGDKDENRKIMETFGHKPNMRAEIAKGAAKIAKLTSSTH